ncbi:MAG: hypothetical protein EOO46_13255 [Flavobacterium sp.]|nr:MAG: hypothetical protein EOO46_13255 [Flavobacterium sp.]
MNSVKLKTAYYEQLGLLLVNPSFSGKIKFEYNGNGQIIKMIGGFVSFYYPTGSGFEEGLFINDSLVNEVSYSGNVITAQDNYRYDMPGRVIDYKIEYGKLITRKVRGYDDNGTEVITDFQYEYSSNQIIERKDNKIFRTFYFEDDNLVKVEQVTRNYLTGEIMWKTEIVFSDYDSYENLLQGKYFVNGTFFKAFSKNNFRKLQKKHYDYIAGQYVDSGNSTMFSFESVVDQNGLVDLFETACN